MKKFLLNSLIVTVFVLILLFLFHTQIITTYVWYLAKGTATDNPAVYVVPEADTTHLATPDTVSFPQRRFQSLEIPLIFNDSVVKHESTSTLAITNTDNTKVYTIWEGTRFAKVFLTEKHTDVEERAVCYTLSDWKEERLNVCTSNLLFLTKLLHTDPTDVRLFSSRDRKVSASLLLILKSTYLDERTTKIAPITIGDRIRGYQVWNPDVFSLLLFDDNDNPYLMTFSKLSDTEIQTVLSNLVIAGTR